uniref:Ig-like domain-containing protein n=1 Tax=Myripristis murdjan TaxID=586833 RepID=A0A667ZMZ4_9TELE
MNERKNKCLLHHRDQATEIKLAHINSTEEVRAVVGENVTLPCQTEPPKDLQSLTVEWKNNESYVHLYRHGQDDHDLQQPQYTNRTILSHEDLIKGNLSLKLLHVQLSDQGNYTCSVVKLSEKEKITRGHVILIGKHCKSIRGRPSFEKKPLASPQASTCESKGWYPEPELFWLDAEGKLLSAGAPETVRGPDGLYTVSSRVTVEKSHSNSFTCRVQQLSINQSRDTHIHVPGQRGFYIVTINAVSLVLNS